MRRIVFFLGLSLSACPLLAQEVFEVPIELGLPAAPLVFELSNASLDVVLEDGVEPVLRAFAGADVVGAEVELIDRGTAITVRRPSSRSAGAGPPRLRLELVTDPDFRLDVRGSDLEVNVEAPPPPANFGEEDDDDDENDDEDDEEEQDDEDGEGEEEQGAIPVAPATPFYLSLQLVASSVNLTGVAGPNITAEESYVRTSGTRGQMLLTLTAGTAEIDSHVGPLDLNSRNSDVTLSETAGRMQPVVKGGSLLVQDSSGQIEGTLEESLLRLEEWRGVITLGGQGLTVEARALAGTRFEVKGANHSISIIDLQGSVQADLTGGNLAANQTRGQFQVTARRGADISIDGFEGRPKLDLTNSSANVYNVQGPLDVTVKGGRLEVGSLQRLELVANNAEVVVGSGLEGLGKAEITNSQLELDLSEVRQNPTLNLRGTTHARVRMQLPCSVKMSETQLLGGGAQVNGCDVHSQTVRRKRHERRNLYGQRRVTLNAQVSPKSTLDVEGVP